MSRSLIKFLGAKRKSNDRHETGFWFNDWSLCDSDRVRLAWNKRYFCLQTIECTRWSHERTANSYATSETPKQGVLHGVDDSSENQTFVSRIFTVSKRLNNFMWLIQWNVAHTKFLQTRFNLLKPPAGQFILLLSDSSHQTNLNLNMKKHESMLALAAETATTSPFRLAHGAVLVRSGAVQATASNNLGGNRLSPSCPSTHAEIATLARFFGGSVKQCFEKPSKDFYFNMEKEQRQQQQHKSTFDPSEPKQRVSRSSKQRQQQHQRRRRRGGLSYTTFVSRPESCVKRVKQKDAFGKKDGSPVLWY